MIIVRLDRALADRKVRSKDIAREIGMSEVNFSRIKNAKLNTIRFSTLDSLCRVLKCQPGDLLEYIEDE